jgi:glycosyltransferase involved in cell wall biosynthesis
MTPGDGMQRAWQLWQRSGWSGVRRTLRARLLSQNVWARYSEQATNLTVWMDFSEKEVADSQILHRLHSGPLPLRSLGWFIPDFYHPFYGGIHTILRFANHLQGHKGVRNQFFVAGTIPARRIANLIARAFPALSDAPVTRLTRYTEIPALPETDASIATLWTTAYFLLKYNQTRRKFYFLQDYEPLFYPAGSTAAQVEATYHFGFYGLANTPSVKQVYEEHHGGHAECFVPCVDPEIFRPAPSPRPAGPFTIFFYGRPEQPRNGFELGAAALRQVKHRLGANSRIVAAGASWDPGDHELKGVVENLGLLGYTQTADLYHTCDAGLVLMFTRHPSYLPLELMASGCLVVTNCNPATQWLVRDRENCLLAQPSATCLADALEWAAAHPAERGAITATAASEVRTRYSDWGREIDKMYRFMCDPLKEDSCAL